VENENFKLVLFLTLIFAGYNFQSPSSTIRLLGHEGGYTIKTERLVLFAVRRNSRA
jgi:hypothetical protein